MIAGLTLCLIRSVVGTFFIEQGGLKIAFPPDAARDYKDGFDMSLANFGSPRYGGELRCVLSAIDDEDTGRVRVASCTSY